MNLDNGIFPPTLRNAFPWNWQYHEHLEELPELLGDVIRKRRIDLGLNQGDLAHRAKLAPSYISKIESNQLNYPPSHDAIAAIAQALELEDYHLQLLSGRLPQSIRNILFTILFEISASEEAIDMIEGIAAEQKRYRDLAKQIYDGL